VCLWRHAVPHPYCSVQIDPAFCPLWDDKMSIRTFGGLSNTKWQIRGRNRICSDGRRLIRWTGWTPIMVLSWRERRKCYPGVVDNKTLDCLQAISRDTFYVTTSAVAAVAGRRKTLWIWESKVILECIWLSFKQFSRPLYLSLLIMHAICAVVQFSKQPMVSEAQLAAQL